MDRSQSKPSWLHLLRDDDLATIGYTSRGDLPMHVVTPYSSFNLCHYTGDDDRRVERCRRMLAAELGVEECNVIVPRQTHSVNILSLIDSIDVNALDLEGIDGLVTNIPEIVIGVNTADCLPVVAFDETNGVAGVAHAGWRGAIAGIITSLIDRMIEAGGSAEDMEIYLGPAICKDCFEVGEEVAVEFPTSVVDRSLTKPHVDLYRYACERLIGRNVNEKRIHCTPQELCTKCHSGTLFSARASGITSGRNYTFIKLGRQGERSVKLNRKVD